MTITTQTISRQVAGGQIAGVELRVLQMNHDERGCFTEVFQDHWGTCLKPVQWSVVHSRPGVMRGPHLHRNHDEYIAVLKGRASIGLRDMRPNSPTHGVWSLYELCGDSLACVVFPLGLLHGWYFHEETLHLQSVSESYIDYHKEDNLGCIWNDPDHGIPWPVTEVIIADRAAGFPPFRTLVSQLEGWVAPMR
jgi:dTDP-4-dehydrorhamnose 3,5-epimerase